MADIVLSGTVESKHALVILSNEASADYMNEVIGGWFPDSPLDLWSVTSGDYVDLSYTSTFGEPPWIYTLRVYVYKIDPGQLISWDDSSFEVLTVGGDGQHISGGMWGKYTDEGGNHTTWSWSVMDAVPPYNLRPMPTGYSRFDKNKCLYLFPTPQSGPGGSTPPTTTASYSFSIVDEIPVPVVPPQEITKGECSIVGTTSIVTYDVGWQVQPDLIFISHSEIGVPLTVLTPPGTYDLRSMRKSIVNTSVGDGILQLYWLIILNDMSYYWISDDATLNEFRDVLIQGHLERDFIHSSEFLAILAGGTFTGTEGELVDDLLSASFSVEYDSTEYPNVCLAPTGSVCTFDGATATIQLEASATVAASVNFGSAPSGYNLASAFAAEGDAFYSVKNDSTVFCSEDLAPTIEGMGATTTILPVGKILDLDMLCAQVLAQGGGEVTIVGVLNGVSQFTYTPPTNGLETLDAEVKIESNLLEVTAGFLLLPIAANSGTYALTVPHTFVYEGNEELCSNTPPTEPEPVEDEAGDFFTQTSCGMGATLPYATLTLNWGVLDAPEKIVFEPTEVAGEYAIPAGKLDLRGLRDKVVNRTAGGGTIQSTWVAKRTNGTLWWIGDGGTDVGSSDIVGHLALDVIDTSELEYITCLTVKTNSTATTHAARLLGELKVYYNLEDYPEVCPELVVDPIEPVDPIDPIEPIDPIPPAIVFPEIDETPYEGAIDYNRTEPSVVINTEVDESTTTVDLTIARDNNEIDPWDLYQR